MKRSFYYFLILLYGLWIVRVICLMPMDYALTDPWAKLAWSQSLRILFSLMPVLMYLFWVDGVNPAHYLGVTTFPTGRRLVYGLAIMAGFLFLITAGACVLQGANLHKLRAMSGNQWCLLLVSMGIVAIVEEAVFRGFIFQQLRTQMSFSRASLISAGLFLLIHWPGWLYMQGLHAGLITLCVSILFIGWVLAWLMETTRSLWPPILLHLLNNVWSALLF